MSGLSEFYLPDLLSVCPLRGSTNPHYREAGAESSLTMIVSSYNVFTDRKRAFFVQGCNELLVSHTYPYAGYDEFRMACDFVNLLFVVDEVSDDQDGQDARRTGKIFLDAMHDPACADDSKLSKMTKEFRARFMALAGEACARRFLAHCDDYIECVSREAEYRERGEVLDPAAFTHLRRENSAIRLCFGLFEAMLHIDLPDCVFEDATFMKAYWAAADMVCWSNDVYSYNMEQAKGHSGNNIVTVLMKANGTSLQDTSDRIGDYFAQLMDDLTTATAALPSWGPAVDAGVAQYVRAMEHWVVGNLIWSFETQRYFGPAHDEIRETLCVVLRPREYADDDEEIEI